MMGSNKPSMADVSHHFAGNAREECKLTAASGKSCWPGITGSRGLPQAAGPTPAARSALFSKGSMKPSMPGDGHQQPPVAWDRRGEGRVFYAASEFRRRLSPECLRVPGSSGLAVCLLSALHAGIRLLRSSLASLRPPQRPPPLHSAAIHCCLSISTSVAIPSCL